ncbi:MAG: Crp/Fnr family transcriptional regulator [Rikenellaceae bacterium]
MCRGKSDEELQHINCDIPHNTQKYQQGEYIAYQGDTVGDLAMLVRGRVKTQIVSDSGLTLPMEEIEAIYPLAASFIFADDNRYPVDVIAMNDCEVIHISKEALEQQMARCSSFLRGFLSFSANKMQGLTERLKIFAQKGIKAKMGYYILSIEKGRKFDIEHSVAYLASYFGVERPSLSRAIYEMVSDGIITFEAGKGEILDLEGLRGLIL